MATTMTVGEIRRIVLEELEDLDTVGDKEEAPAPKKKPPRVPTKAASKNPPPGSKAVKVSSELL